MTIDPSGRSPLVGAFLCTVLLGLGGAVASCGGNVNHGAASDAGSDVSTLDGASADSAPLSFIAFDDVPSGGDFIATFLPPSTLPGNCPPPPIAHGACTVYPPCSLPSPDAGLADAGWAHYTNAGTLTITGTTSAVMSVTPGSDGTYEAMTSGPLFLPGAKLGVAASGADFPGFPEQTVRAPMGIALVSPRLPYTISTSADLAVAWTGGELGAQVILAFEAGAGLINCWFDAAAGQGTVPAVALDGLSGNGSILFGQHFSTEFAAGGHRVQLTALNDTTAPATFQ